MNPETKGRQPDQHVHLEQICPSWETFVKTEVGKGLEASAWGDKGQERKKKQTKATPHNLENPALESKGGFQREQQFSCPQTDQAVLMDDPWAISQGLQPKFCSPL